MIEVFKTNVRNKMESRMVLSPLSEVYPSARINFDLTDRDRVLRVEGEKIEPTMIILLVKKNGFECEVLD